MKNTSCNLIINAVENRYVNKTADEQLEESLDTLILNIPEQIS